VDPVHSKKTAVVIVGAGPAGLVLGNLLLAEDIPCVILERSSRAHIEQRARAGFLAANTVRILEENGLAAGLRKHGRPHNTCSFRSDVGEFELNYARLGLGEIHTVYPQQDLVRDLVAEFLVRGGDLRFETGAVTVHDVDTSRPWVASAGNDGRHDRWDCEFVAGCDGQHGIAAQAVPRAAARRYERTHGITWLATLAQVPQSMASVTYAVHDEGFAGHMARSANVTRYYLQCSSEDDPEAWSDARIWESLHRRFRADQHGALTQGPILERRLVHMRSVVMDPIQFGRLFLVGDAASLISPSAAKGANLAVMEAEVLAHALRAQRRQRDEAPLARYSAACLPRIWRAQEFSHWMIHLLHGPTGTDAESSFLRALHLTRLENLKNNRAHQDLFAEGYVGI
jgi:p-hydroxybenzoate 3-monooxygenase